jgi:hypothetical protein
LQNVIEKSSLSGEFFHWLKLTHVFQIHPVYYFIQLNKVKM